MKAYIFSMAILLAISIHSYSQRKDELSPEMRYHNRDIPFDPITASIGDKACVAPASGSYEHHVWVLKKDFYRSSSCIFTVERVKTGWRIWTNDIGIAEISSDSNFERLGYIRIVEVTK